MSEPRPVILLHALEEEGLPFAAALRADARTAVSGLDTMSGVIGTTPVVAVRTGIGKVAAAHAASTAIERFRPAAVVVFGAAGALDNSVEVGDLIVGLTLIQHDLGVRESRRSTADPALSKELAAFLRTRGSGRVHEGTILTGDKACVTLRRKLRLRLVFRSERPVAVDMESAAIASVANRTGVPAVVLRVATDRAGPLALLEFRRNVDRHAAAPASAVLEWLLTRNR